VAWYGDALDLGVPGKGFNPLFGQLLLVWFANLCQELFKVSWTVHRLGAGAIVRAVGLSNVTWDK
jgi:hypothetical protein